MIIQNLEHLETLGAVAQATPASTKAASIEGGQSLMLALRQGILQLSLNGKELLKTTLTDYPADVNISIKTGRWPKLYQLGLVGYTSDGSVSGVIDSSAGVTAWNLLPHQGISAVASSSISVSP